MHHGMFMSLHFMSEIVP